MFCYFDNGLIIFIINCLYGYKQPQQDFDNNFVFDNITF